MRKNFYLPRQQAHRLTWLFNFKTELALIAQSFGITSAQLTAIENFYLALKYMLDLDEVIADFQKQCSEYKNLLMNAALNAPLGALPVFPVFTIIPDTVPAGGFRMIAEIVNSIKKHVNYNVSVGQTLGIIGADETIDFSSLKAKGSLKESAISHILLDFVKKGMDGVIIYTAYNPAGALLPAYPESAINWQPLARVNHSPYMDIRLNQARVPEVRLYKFVYFKNDKIVGQESEIIRVLAEVYVDQSGADLSGKVK
jgi:hypothetical protein